jgi:hypothetical protein
MPKISQAIQIWYLEAEERLSLFTVAFGTSTIAPWATECRSPESSFGVKN